MEEGKSLSVGTEVRVHRTDVLLSCAFYENRCRTVAEEGACAAVFIVDN